MAVKLGMVMKLAVLALLLAAVYATATSVDLFDLLASNNPKAFQLVKYKRPDTKPCCNKCICTKSNPPQCTCRDVFIGLERCEGCDFCICTKSMPPQCRCPDVRDYCLPKCKTTTTVSAEAIVAAAEIASSN
ncbi:hypothetical protein FNV43_RR19922 [Rhamnella rubrinervis]|uniref:Bowman-Birk serine protease inhibitors family domain-containing protein n=1 Tax=Rhamnella rubrinervis TaxID=2594499 RepID=A0A8K0GSW2_9ROSA|nr:hypothetical protein FNV43_RR19922 [Rhamnella rubrinervis]